MSETLTPEGHVDEVGCWCGPTVHPVSGLGHTLAVTAPSPAGLSPLLDQLDEARASIGDSPAFRVLGFLQDDENPEQVLARFDDGGTSVFAECYGVDAAALIVAAVNALPELIRLAREREALRQAVEALAVAQGDDSYVMTYALRAALTAALTLGADTAGATA